MSEYNEHKPVLIDEVLSFVEPNKKIAYLDLTLGRAGHATKILKKAGAGSTLIGVDRDKDALTYCKEHLPKELPSTNLYFLHAAFANAVDTLRRSGFEGADFILMDIGVSSPQFDDPSRGFSYRYDAPLDMRMDQRQSLTAKEIVNTYSEKDLLRVFKELGQCSSSYPVVKEILRRREEKEIETTFELVDIIKSSLPRRELRKEGHPAKQFFLGLRYEVNGEIEQLKKGVTDALSFLNKNGRLVVISFNSEEDKIVKDAFNRLVDKNHVDKYKKDKEESGYLLLTKKPLLPSQKEVESNSRSKCAILRAIERRG